MPDGESVYMLQFLHGCPIEYDAWSVTGPEEQMASAGGVNRTRPVPLRKTRYLVPGEVFLRIQPNAAHVANDWQKHCLPANEAWERDA